MTYPYRERHLRHGPINSRGVGTVGCAKRQSNITQSTETQVMSDRDDSMSVGGGDSDKETLDDHSQGVGAKPGRKKSSSSQVARRDQNRIAQREFRLRKQQRIRDLEARVEILSGGKDEALSEIRNILKDLMQENQQLRTLLRSVTAFIGDGAGGLLQRLGWTLSDFSDYINKSETDTAWESYQSRKKNDANVVANSSSVQNRSTTHKRPPEDDSINVSRSKKSRGPGERDGDRDDGLNLLVPMSSSASHLGMYPPSSSTRPSHDTNLFPDLIKGSSTSAIFTRSPTATSGSSQYGTAPSAAGTYSSPYIPPNNVNIDSPLPYSSSNFHGPIQQQRLAQTEQQQDTIDDETDDPDKHAAFKLIGYHLDNYQRNNSYHLPASLRPTLIQKNIAHESMIDKIPHPELRDRMILLRGRYDLADCLMEFRQFSIIHGDDVLAHSNWEISEKWLRKYSFLIDNSTVSNTNKWRIKRGDPELRLADLIPGEPGSA